jgi:AAA family ATP:ADP antiporter
VLMGLSGILTALVPQSGLRSEPSPERSALERLLSVFGDVRAGEGGTALLLFLNAVIMMGLYYILKPIREGLILSGFGAVIKSYSSAAQALLFIAVVPAYGAFAARVNRVWLLSGMTLFFISNLAAFVLALGIGMRVGVVFYIWFGIFNFMVVSQFWAFANDVYTEEQGRRLFPIVGVGASAGAVLGTVLTASVFNPMSNAALMILASVLLLVFIALVVWVNGRETASRGAKGTRTQEPLSREGGFGLVVRDRYLLLIAVHILLLNLVNTVGEFILGKLFLQHAIEQVGAGEDFREARSLFIRTMYGTFFGWVNSIGLAIQALLVSRFIKKLGIRGSLFIGPIVSLAAYGVSAARPVLDVVRVAKTGENANDYSTNNTVRQALFLPTSREAKYKAKAAIDTFFARTGDALQAVVVFAGTSLAFGLSAFAVVNVAIVGVWFLVVAGIARQHRRLTAEA